MKRARSAGGVVFRRDGGAVSVLLLKHSSGKWMLPKGTIEAGETPQAVALREVGEEAGLSRVRVVADLGEERYHFFWRTENTYYDKSVRYFLLEFLGGEDAVPQSEEGFAACEWVPLDEAIERIKYKETREVVRRARELLQSDAEGTAGAPDVKTEGHRLTEPGSGSTLETKR